MTFDTMRPQFIPSDQEDIDRSTKELRKWNDAIIDRPLTRDPHQERVRLFGGEWIPTFGMRDHSSTKINDLTWGYPFWDVYIRCAEEERFDLCRALAERLYVYRAEEARLRHSLVLALKDAKDVTRMQTISESEDE